MALNWRNTPDPYNDYILLHEAPPKMAWLLKTYGWFFDDEYFYWLVKNGYVIKRRPLYWYPQKSTPCEKHRKPNKGVTKITAF